MAKEYFEEPREIKEKVSSRGQEMIERRLKEREKETVELPENIRDVLGGGALKTWSDIHSLSKLPESLRAERLRIYERKFQQQFIELNEQLQRTAVLVPEELEKFFCDYFENLPNFNEMLAKYQSSEFFYEENEETEDFIKEGMNRLREEGNTLPRKKLYQLARQKVISSERAYIMVQTYMNKEDEEIPYSSEFIMPLVAHRAEQLAKRSAELQEKFGVWRDKFSERANVLAREEVLPIDQTLISERLQNISFEVVDDFVAELEDKWGDFVADTHRIRLSANVPAEEELATFFHEAVHSLSGQTEAVEKDIPDLGSTGGNNEQTRIGLSFIIPESLWADMSFERDMRRPEFGWLNEAITEQITLEFLEKKDSYAYKSERKLLERLIKSGISRETFWRAYFENYEVEGELKMPALRKLFSESNHVLGPGFLVNLDSFIRFQMSETRKSRSEVIEKILQTWNKKGKKFNDYLRQWKKKKLS